MRPAIGKARCRAGRHILRYRLHWTVLPLLLILGVPVDVTGRPDPPVLQLEVGCAEPLGPRSPMLEPGAVCTGGVLWHRPDTWTLQDWFVTHEIRAGSYRVTARLNAIEDGDLDLPDLNLILSAAREAGRTVIVKIWGTPRSVTSLPDSLPADVFEQNYWKFPPADSLWWRWREIVYDLVAYLSAPGASVSDSSLFGDLEEHSSLGLENLSYELWNEHNYPGSWMPALGESLDEGSEEAFYRLYQETWAAIDSVQIGYPGTQIEALGVSFRLGRGNHDWGDPFDEEGYPSAVRRLAGFCRQNNLPLDRVSSWVYDYVPNSTAGDVRDPHGIWQEAFREALDDSGFTAAKINIGEWSMHFASNLLLPPAGEPSLLSGANINDDNEVGAAFSVVRMMDMRQDALASDASYFDFIEGSPTDAGSVFPLYKYDSAVYTTSGLYKAQTNTFFLIGKLGDTELQTTRILPDSLPVSDPGHYYLNGYGTATPGESIDILLWYYYDFFDALRPGEAWADSIHYEDVRALADSVLPEVVIDLRTVDLGAVLNRADSLLTRTYLVDRWHSNSWEYRYAIGQALAELPDSMRRSFIRQTVNGWCFTQGDTISVALEEVARESLAWADTLESSLLLQPFSVALVTIQAKETGSSVAEPADGERSRPFRLRIFPNPVGGERFSLEISPPPGWAREPSVDFYDVTGRRVLRVPLSAPDRLEDAAQLLLRRLPLGGAGGGKRLTSGVYFVRASWDPRLRVRMLVVR